MKKYVSTILKYLFSFIFLVLSIKTTKDARYVIFGLLELITLFSVSDFLVRKSKWFNILTGVMSFLFNIEVCVLYFGNSFITLIMLESLYNLKDLAGKAFIYGLGVIFTIVFSFLPVYPVEIIEKLLEKKRIFVIAVFTAITAVSLFFAFNNEIPYSPVAGYINLYKQWDEKRELTRMMNEFMEEDEEKVTKSEPKAVSNNKLTVNDKQTSASSNSSDTESANDVSIDSAEDESENAIMNLPFEERIPYVYEVGEETEHEIIGSNVNVILIFMEGLSKNIVNDQRALMPNVSGIMANSINYTNYYNHTFATYRGLEGQLYSGNSLNDQDTNSMVSLMDVLKVNGYYTSFINTEPNNQEFSAYLGAMPFDVIISDNSLCEGPVSNISDKVAYQKLFDTAMEYNNEGKKFFLAMYSMGTHASFNSFDEVYGDGSSPFLNKFYNADCQFGKFFANYLNSSLPANTMVVFTTDHATYCDEDFKTNCPGYFRLNNAVDEIPFFIYYQGKKASVDADGRNSLDMAPTLLDILGLAKPDNFLGDSLYGAKYENTILDTFFWNPDCIVFSGDKKMRIANSDERKYVSKQMAKYFSKK